METKAILRGARISAQKVRLVADQVRGLPVGRASDLLQFSDKKAAQVVRKVLLSALLKKVVPTDSGQLVPKLSAEASAPAVAPAVTPMSVVVVSIVAPVVVSAVAPVVVSVWAIAPTANSATAGTARMTCFIAGPFSHCSLVAGQPLQPVWPGIANEVQNRDCPGIVPAAQVSSGTGPAPTASDRPSDA